MPGDTNLSSKNGRNNNYNNHDSRYYLSTNNVRPLHTSSAIEPPIHTGLCYSPLWPTQLMMMTTQSTTKPCVGIVVASSSLSTHNHRRCSDHLPSLSLHHNQQMCLSLTHHVITLLIILPRPLSNHDDMLKELSHTIYGAFMVEESMDDRACCINDRCLWKYNSRWIRWSTVSTTPSYCTTTPFLKTREALWTMRMWWLSMISLRTQ